MLFEEIYEEYKIYAQKRHKKQGFDTLKQNFNLHVLPYFKNKTILEIGVQDIISWQDKILDKNFSNNYNRNLFQALNSFYKFCSLKYSVVNVASLVGPFQKKIENKTHDIYNWFEFRKFRKGIGNLIYKYFFDLLFYYGPRSGEAMALRFSDLQGKQLHVGASMRRRGKREIGTPKTKNSNRNLYLKISMRFKLFILRCMYVKKYGDSEYDYFIFGGKTPLSPTSIIRYKHNACLKVGIREITTHEFRHSYATRMIRKKKPIDIVSKSLGHSSVAITLDIYVHNEKRQTRCLFSHTLKQNFNKFMLSIITRFV